MNGDACLAELTTEYLDSTMFAAIFYPDKWTERVIIQNQHDHGFTHVAASQNNLCLQGN